MLLNLHVKNLALIEEVDVDFEKGLIVLTGETGAGKSLILGSVNIALGNKASKDMIRKGTDYSLVELTFSVSENCAKQLKKYDIYMEEDNIVTVTRKISEGRSISKINGETVNIKTLKNVMSLLIDIHGQHDHQSLLYTKNHLDILDKFAKDSILELKEKILSDGEIIEPDILKVDSFINHQIDPKTYRSIAKEIKRRFAGEKIDKILTIEASGIALGLALSYELNDIPVVFAKKGTSKTVNDDLYTSEVYSYTKGTRYIACVKKKYLNENENVILVDDFLADGNAMLGLVDMCNQAKAHIVGCGIIIEKGFQKGHQKLVDLGYRVESLAIIESFENGKIVFK